VAFFTIFVLRFYNVTKKVVKTRSQNTFKRALIYQELSGHDMFNVNWKDYKEGLKGGNIRGFLGNRISFKKEIKEGKNFCT